VANNEANHKATNDQARVRSTGHGNRLDGEKSLVEYGRDADILVVVADQGETDGTKALLVVDRASSGITVTPVEHLGGKPQAIVTFRDVELAEQAITPLSETDLQTVSTIRHRARLLQAAELLGISEVARDLGVEYAKNRVQYGRPIGAFQAIQHKCTDMGIQVDLLTWLTYYAAWCLDQDENGDAAVAMAALKAGPIALYVTSESVTVHGGVGVMEVSDIGLYYTRAKAGQLQLGYPDELRERVANAL
jgi:alkylation response protein AidB-like acyl-CoA dehydrogenase